MWPAYFSIKSMRIQPSSKSIVALLSVLKCQGRHRNYTRRTLCNRGSPLLFTSAERSSDSSVCLFLSDDDDGDIIDSRTTNNLTKASSKELMSNCRPNRAEICLFCDSFLNTNSSVRGLHKCHVEVLPLLSHAFISA